MSFGGGAPCNPPQVPLGVCRALWGRTSRAPAVGSHGWVRSLGAGLSAEAAVGGGQGAAVQSLELVVLCLRVPEQPLSW